MAIQIITENGIQINTGYTLAGGSASTLNGLSDVDAGSPGDTHILQYNSSNSAWQNTNIQDAGIQEALSGLSLVSVTVAGTDKVLIQDADDSDGLRTVTAQSIADLGGGGGASELSDLSDVNTSTPTNRNVLVADGVDFESRALVEADISDLGSYQPLDSHLTSLAGLTPGTEGRMITSDGLGTYQISSPSDVRGYLNVEDGADVTDTTNVTSAGALMDSEVNNLSGIKTLTVPDNTTISTFGASLIDDVDAETARTTLGLGSIATLSSIDISDNTNLTAGDGMDLNNDTVSLDINGLTEESGFTSGDFLAFYDATAGAVRKVDYDDLPGASGGISNVVDDTSPQLGGNLDTNSFEISFDDDHGILDGNNNKLLNFVTVGSNAVYLEITGAVSGNRPTLSAEGTDTNIDFGIGAKGTGDVIFSSDVQIGSNEISGSNVSFTGGSITGITDLAVADGGTGASNASGARSNLDAQQTLSGLSISTATVASTDKVLVQDADDSDNLKTVTAQSIADLGGGGASQLSDLSDVNTSTPTNRNVLVADGVDFESRALVEADISDLGTYQTQDAGLTSIAGLTTSANQMIYLTGSDTYATTSLSAFGRTLVDDADAATARTTLGLGTLATQNSVDISDDTNLAVGDGIDLTGDTVSLDIDGLTAETSLDATNDYFPLYNDSGSNLRKTTIDDIANAITTSGTKSITVEDPDGTEDITIWKTTSAITITEIGAVLLGSSTPSVTFTIRHNSDRSATGNEVVTSGTTVTSTTTGSTVSSFNDATIPADSWVWFETTAQSGTVDEISVTLDFTYD